jgi:hypothetical protein
MMEVIKKHLIEFVGLFGGGVGAIGGWLHQTIFASWQYSEIMGSVSATIGVLVALTAWIVQLIKARNEKRKGDYYAKRN